MSAYAHPESLVDPDWVQAHGRDPGVRVVEVDVDTTAYGSGHVPGAVSFNWQTQLQDPLRREVVGRVDFERLLEEAGIDRDTTVILYGDNNNWFAAYGYWLLRYYGHREVKLMNGGRKKWLAEGRPLEMEVPRPARTTYRVGVLDSALRAYREEALSITQGTFPNASLVDVRSEAEYTGEILAPPGLSETAQRAGHIPGAVNVPWSRAANEDGTFKSADELRALYQPLGVTPERRVLTYCRIGERSSHTWFVLHELLGYPNVANYDGSWTEWGSMIGMPVERGNPVLAGTAA